MTKLIGATAIALILGTTLASAQSSGGTASPNSGNSSAAGSQATQSNSSNSGAPTTSNGQ